MNRHRREDWQPRPPGETPLWLGIILLCFVVAAGLLSAAIKIHFIWKFW